MHIGGGTQLPRFRSFGDHLANILLDDGCDALIDQVHLGLVGIHADHVMAIAGQAAGGNRAHVAQAKNTDSHLPPPLLILNVCRLSFVPDDMIIKNRAAPGVSRYQAWSSRKPDLTIPQKGCCFSRQIDAKSNPVAAFPVLTPYTAARPPPASRNMPH